MAFDQVAYVKRWRREHPEQVMRYKRKELIARATAMGVFPRPATIRKFCITEQELRELARTVVARNVVGV